MREIASSTTVRMATGTKSICARKPTRPDLSGSASARSATRWTIPRVRRKTMDASSAMKTTRTSVPARSHVRAIHVRLDSNGQISGLSEARLKSKPPRSVKVTPPCTVEPGALRSSPPTIVTLPPTTACGPRRAVPPITTTSPRTSPRRTRLPPIATTSRITSPLIVIGAPNTTTSPSIRPLRSTVTGLPKRTMSCRPEVWRSSRSGCQALAAAGPVRAAAVTKNIASTGVCRLATIISAPRPHPDRCPHHPSRHPAVRTRASGRGHRARRDQTVRMRRSRLPRWATSLPIRWS